MPAVSGTVWQEEDKMGIRGSAMIYMLVNRFLSYHNYHDFFLQAGCKEIITVFSVSRFCGNFFLVALRSALRISVFVSAAVMSF